VLGAYGHHFLGVARPVVPPPPGILSDLEIMQGLAARTGLAEVMAGDARAWKKRLIGPKLGPHGIGIDDLEEGAVRNPLAAKILFADRNFATASGRVNLMTALPEPCESAGEPDFPLFLMALSTDKAQSSQWVRAADEGPALVTVHPTAAAGVPDG